MIDSLIILWMMIKNKYSLLSCFIIFPPDLIFDHCQKKSNHIGSETHISYWLSIKAQGNAAGMIVI